MQRKRAWKNRELLKEIIMSDGFKIEFWRYEWNDDVATRLKHNSCIRMLKKNPEGRFLFTEQIGIRLDNWSTFSEALKNLKIDQY
jgi:hypothetical protein